MQVIRCYNERCEFRNAKSGFCDFDVMREGVILSIGRDGVCSGWARALRKKELERIPMAEGGTRDEV